MIIKINSKIKIDKVRYSIVDHVWDYIFLFHICNEIKARWSPLNFGMLALLATIPARRLYSRNNDICLTNILNNLTKLAIMSDAIRRVRLGDKDCWGARRAPTNVVDLKVARPSARWVALLYTVTRHTSLFYVHTCYVHTYYVYTHSIL